MADEIDVKLMQKIAYAVIDECASQQPYGMVTRLIGYMVGAETVLRFADPSQAQMVKDAIPHLTDKVVKAMEAAAEKEGKEKRHDA